MVRCGVLVILILGAGVVSGQEAISDADADVVVTRPTAATLVATSGTVINTEDYIIGGMRYHRMANSGGAVDFALDFAEYNCIVGPGVWEFYVRSNTGTTHAPGKVELDLDHSTASAQASRTFSTYPLPTDANVTLNSSAGTTAGMYSSYAKVGAVTLVGGGSCYVRVYGRTGQSVITTGPIVAKRISSVPSWFAYLGGDVDTGNYFNGLDPGSCNPSAVILPTNIVYANVSSLEGVGLYFFDNIYDNTTQSGVVERYVQLTFDDARYGIDVGRESATVGRPTFAWFIAIGRNGGLTAKTAKILPDSALTYSQYWTSSWYHGAVSGGTQQWHFDAQMRSVIMAPRFTASGFVVDPTWGTSLNGRLARWPFHHPHVFAGPGVKSNAFAGTGAGGVNPPTAPVAPTGGTAANMSTTPATNPDVYFAQSVPAGYTAIDPRILQAGSFYRYPLHLNHLKAIVAAVNANPPLGDSEVKFGYLLSKFVQACEDEDYSFTEYRAEVAKGAADTVTLESQSSSDFGEAQPVDPIEAFTAPSRSGQPDNDNPFDGTIANVGHDFIITWDLNTIMTLIGRPTDPNLVFEFHTNLEAGKAAAGAEAQDYYDTLILWRNFIRGLQVVLLIAFVIVYKVRAVMEAI